LTPKYIKKKSNYIKFRRIFIWFRSIFIWLKSFFLWFKYWYGSYDTSIMVPTTRPLWYLPHERYGSYHNVVLENQVILFGINELIPFYLQR